MIWLDVGYWDIDARLKPLLHLWSLGVEEQFYIITPFLLFFAWKKNVRITTLLIILFLISFSLNIHYYKRYPEFVFYMPFFRFFEILAGSILACAIKDNNQWLHTLVLRTDYILKRICTVKPTENDGSFFNNILSVFGIVLIFSAVRFCRVDENFPGISALLPVFGALCIIAAGPRARLNRWLLSNKLAVGIGLISYPLYLWHWPVLSYLQILGWDKSPEWHFIRLGAMLAAVLLSIITYKYIESPVRFTKRKHNAQIWILVFIMACIVSSGFYIYKNNVRTTVFHTSTIYYGAQTGVVRTFAPEEMEAGRRYAHGMLRGWKVRFRDTGSPTTVAIIGDSHGESAFFGIANKNAELGINTVSLYCRPQPYFYKAELLEFLTKKSDITSVFIFSRGILNLKGEDIDNIKWKWKFALLNNFEPSVQDLIDKLLAINKKVYFVSENPVLTYNPRHYLHRPFGYFKLIKPMPPTKDEVITHQQDYLAVIDRLQGATIINSIDSFCPNNQCIDVLDDGQVLYFDDDHLSLSGSTFQANTVLAPYLEQIAKERLP